MLKGAWTESSHVCVSVWWRDCVRVSAHTPSWPGGLCRLLPLIRTLSSFDFHRNLLPVLRHQAGELVQILRLSQVPVHHRHISLTPLSVLQTLVVSGPKYFLPQIPGPLWSLHPGPRALPSFQCSSVPSDYFWPSTSAVMPVVEKKKKKNGSH